MASILKTFILLSLASVAFSVPVAYDNGMWYSGEGDSSVAPVAYSAPTPTLALASSTATPSSGGGIKLSTPALYVHYRGDGSEAQGWPSVDKWVDFNTMWGFQQTLMAVNDSPDEISAIYNAILSEAKTSGVDARYILATIMEESTGNVRVGTTVNGITNIGLMQDHAGTANCINTTPCPAATIQQMIAEGTSGTATGDGLKQILQRQTVTVAQAVYITARIYNSGSYHGGALEEDDGSTPCYCSDIANLLTGWAGDASPCKLGTA
ncbi:hypothetical protein G7Y89_g7261 [Cudoniella acicularis]|uniref:Transglycosylase SLT domain-containing protein n=1 Tax=Cudoniella acicularis TaxID=354080 RepID=A0A8H4W3Z9_9HELO|nr:hypothetical protein G7Y89_g7261 [Cudoniella acicularis]